MQRGKPISLTTTLQPIQLFMTSENHRQPFRDASVLSRKSNLHKKLCEELCRAFLSLDIHKSSGPDNTPPIMLNTSANELTLFQLQGRQPWYTQFKKRVLALIFATIVLLL